MKEISEWLLTNNNLAYAASGMVGIFASLYILYNSLSYVILKERYHGIRFTTKNIAYITMFTAVSVSLTVVISLTIPITVFPPIRVAFEGVMVKITGFIFGPIVGIIVGLITEVLVMILVPSFIHPAFIILVISYGFISGIGASFLRAGKGNNLFIYLLTMLFLMLFGAFMSVIIYYNNSDVKVLAWDIPSKQYMLMFIIVIITMMVIISLVNIILLARKKGEILKVLAPIILFASACEMIATTLISAWGDAGFLGIDRPGGYTAMMISRLIQAPIKIIFNSAILYFVYKAVAPLIQRDF